MVKDRTQTPKALAEKIAKATRLRGMAVEMRQGDKVAVILHRGHVLSYVYVSGRGIRLHVQDVGAERRFHFAPDKIQEAARAVKTSARRQQAA